MDKKFAIFGFLLVLGVFGLLSNFQNLKNEFSEIIIVKEAFAATPVVTTGLATSITSTTATINGTINPGGNSISYWFFYYPNGRADLTQHTTWTSAGNGTSNVAVSANISGLTLGTKYYYYISAKYDGGAYLPNSAVNSFTTTGGASSSSAPTVYGIAETRPYFEPGYEINNIVGVRYKFKIANNDGVNGKIIFGDSRLKGS